MKLQEIRQNRQRLGLSLAALAARASVSRWRLLEGELGNISLTEDEVNRILATMREYSALRIRELGKVRKILELTV